MLRLIGTAGAAVVGVVACMGFWQASTAAVPVSGPDAKLAPEDIGRNGPRLSAENRDAAISLCTEAALKSPTFRIVNGHVTLVPMKSVPGANFHERATRSCECVINALEDRTNAVEFKLAMATVKRKPAATWISYVHNHADYQKAAQRLGISDREFARHSQEVMEAFRSSVRFCAEREYELRSN